MHSGSEDGGRNVDRQTSPSFRTLSTTGSRLIHQKTNSYKEAIAVGETQVRCGRWGGKTWGRARLQGAHLTGLHTQHTCAASWIILAATEPFDIHNGNDEDWCTIVKEIFLNGTRKDCWILEKYFLILFNCVNDSISYTTNKLAH